MFSGRLVWELHVWSGSSGRRRKSSRTALHHRVSKHRTNSWSEEWVTTVVSEPFFEHKKKVSWITVKSLDNVVHSISWVLMLWWIKILDVNKSNISNRFTQSFRTKSTKVLHLSREMIFLLKTSQVLYQFAQNFKFIYTFDLCFSEMLHFWSVFVYSSANVI